MSTKEEIFEYVMKSPENTNPAVLKSMLDGIEGGSSNIQLVPINIEVPDGALSGSDIDYYGLIGGVYYDNNHNIVYETSYINDLYHANFGIPRSIFPEKYLIGFVINTDKNTLNILLNNEEVPFISSVRFQGYNVLLESNTYPTQFNVSISVL